MTDIAKSALAYCKAPLPIELTIRQLALLGVLCDEEGPHHVRHLAQRLGVQKPVITRSVDQFEVMGLARRTKDPVDGRSVHIVASDHGRRLRSQMGVL